MDEHQMQLLRRIEAFPLDDPSAPFTFSARLARDQGWTLDFTHRAIREYRRFVFLAIAAGHPVTPSDQVDQVWHEHLTYTRSYWEKFCGKVLGRPLHHEPTKGGRDEGQKFGDWYARTLASYHTFFGAEPPHDLWPPASQRFGEDIHFSRVNTARHWVIPKPRWLRPILRAALLLPLPLLLTGCISFGTITLNPFDFSGSDFLLFFWTLGALAIIYGFALRNRTLSMPARNDEVSAKPDIYSAALLQSREMAVNAAIAQLVQADYVLADSRGKLNPAALPPHDLDPLERQIYARVAGLSGATIKNVAEFTQPILMEKEQALTEAGLLVPEQRAQQAARQAAMVCFAVVAIGVIKIMAGVSRNKPVGFLIISCLILLLIAFAFGYRPVRRTRAGDRYLNDLREKYESLRKRPLDGVSTFGEASLPLAVGLFGYGVLESAHLSPLRRHFSGSDTGYTAGDSSSSGCSGGGSSDGGGSSGCGGGGCGGCGSS